MRIVVRAIIAISGLAITASATAADEVPRDPSKKERLICRETQTIGSRLGGKRTCLTKRDWDIVSSSGKRFAEDAVTRSHVIDKSPPR
jgi:hypothetical protein